MAQVTTDNPRPTQDNIHSTYFEALETQRGKVVGGLLVFSVCRHEGTHWRHHVPWMWVGNNNVEETKYQHVESYK